MPISVEKAIEILNTHQCNLPRNQVPDLIDAIELAIKIMKASLKDTVARRP